MAERLGSAVLELSTDDKRLKRGLKGAEDRTRKMANRLKGVFAGILTAAVVRGITRSMDRVITRLDTIGKQANKLGLTVEALQELRFAAEKSGIAVNTFDMAFQRFTRRAGEAAKGTGEAKDALKQLGITIDDLRSKNPEELFQQAADALARVEGEAERLRLAFKLFDSEGVAVINMVDNLRELRQEARDLGIVLSQDLVRDATRMKDELTRVFAAIEAAWSKVVITFGRGLDVLFNFLPDTIEEHLKDRIDELRNVQDQLAEDAAKTGVGLMDITLDTKIRDIEFSGTLSEEGIAALNKRAAALQEEIILLAELIEARKKASEFSGSLDPTTTEATDKLGDIIENIERQSNALELRAAAIGMNVGPMAEFIAFTEAMNRANEEGLDLTTQQIDLIRTFAGDVGIAAERLEDAREKTRALNEAIRDQEAELRRDQAQVARLGDSFLQMAVSGRLSFKEMAASIIQDFIRMETRILSSKLFSGDGVSGILSTIIGGLGAVLGGFGGGGFVPPAGASLSAGPFAHGGSFTVGGRGGFDRNLVAFNATRGERVQITPAGKSSGGLVVNINQPIDARGAVEGTAVQIQQALIDNNKRLPNMIRNAQRRGQ